MLDLGKLAVGFGCRLAQYLVSLAVLPDVVYKEPFHGLLQVLFQVVGHFKRNVFGKQSQGIKSSFGTGTEHFAVVLKRITDRVVDVVKNLTRYTCNTQNMLPLLFERDHIAEHLLVGRLNL